MVPSIGQLILTAQYDQLKFVDATTLKLVIKECEKALAAQSRSQTLTPHIKAVPPKRKRDGPHQGRSGKKGCSKGNDQITEYVPPLPVGIATGSPPPYHRGTDTSEQDGLMESDRGSPFGSVEAPIAHTTYLDPVGLLAPTDYGRQPDVAPQQHASPSDSTDWTGKTYINADISSTEISGYPQMQRRSTSLGTSSDHAHGDNIAGAVECYSPNVLERPERPSSASSYTHDSISSSSAHHTQITSIDNVVRTASAPSASQESNAETTDETLWANSNLHDLTNQDIIGEISTDSGNSPRICSNDTGSDPETSELDRVQDARVSDQRSRDFLELYAEDILNRPMELFIGHDLTGSNDDRVFGLYTNIPTKRDMELLEQIFINEMEMYLRIVKRRILCLALRLYIPLRTPTPPHLDSAQAARWREFLKFGSYWRRLIETCEKETGAIVLLPSR